MMNKSKARGTAAETRIVKYLQENGYPQVERRALAGASDKGDIANLPLVVEAKDCVKLEFSKWLKELKSEMQNANLDIGVVWAKKRGTTNPGDWYVMMDGAIFLEVLHEMSKL